MERVAKVVAGEWRSRSRTRVVAAVALGVAGLLGTGAAFSLHSLATALALAPDALTRAQAIRAEVNARYRLLPAGSSSPRRQVGRRHASRPPDDRLARKADLPYGQQNPLRDCSARARCLYPGRRPAWRVAVCMPRRQALEHALRALLETTASLVVVSFPTAQPVWVVCERDDLLASTDVPAVLKRVASNPANIDPPLCELAGRLTRSRLFAPDAMGPDDSIVALRAFGS